MSGLSSVSTCRFVCISSAIIVAACCIFLIAGSVYATSNHQSQRPAQPERILFHDRYQTPEIVSGSFATSTAATMEAKATDFIAARQGLYKMINPDQELDPIKEVTDDLGLSHLRFQQRYMGLKVWGCQTIVHFKDDNIIYLVGGQTIPTPDLATDPALSEITARQKAVSSFKSNDLPADIRTESELIIYPNEGNPRLAWLTTITSPINGATRWRVFVDAQTGDILHKFNDIHVDGPDVGSGPDIFGITRTFPIYYRNSEYQMIDATQPMYSPPIDYLKGVIVTYHNYYNGGPISTDLNGDKVWDDNTDMQAEVSGHYNAILSFEYFYDTFGRLSVDDAGMTVMVNIHDPLYVNNAYWNGEGINFADGDGVNFRPFSGALDVVAHELTHGVTEFTANLVYQFQSGALSEHFSDFFGAMVDRDDWTNGEAITLFAPGFIRSMEDPTLRGHPKHMDQYVNHPYETDNGGVHINCGIPNHAAYWVGTLIGREKAEQIWYRNLTTYMTPLSGFYFWAGMTMQSTIDLYGSTEIEAVNAALDSVGLNTTYAQPEYPEVNTIIGEVGSSSVWIHNPGPGTKQVTSVAPTVSGLSVVPGAGYQEYIPEGGSSEFVLSLDATALDECNVGFVRDTLRFDVSGSIETQIKLWMTAGVGYTTSSLLFSDIYTSCSRARVLNTMAVHDFEVDGFDPVFDGTLMAGWYESGVAEVYRDIYGEQKFAPVDTFSQGDMERSVRFSSYDSRIQGGVTYRYPEGLADTCNFIIADYYLYNPCNTPATIYSGIYFDFDLSQQDLASYDETSNLIYMYDFDDTRACGLTLLSGDAYNLRALHNPDVVYDGFTDATAYWQMASTFNIDGSDPSDWSILLTFGEDALNPGDTAFYSVAIIYSPTGTVGLSDILDQATAWYNRVPYLCGDTNGDESINVGDVVYLVNLIFHDGPSPDPEAAGDVNCDGSVNVGDAVYMTNYVFQEGAPVPCAACPVK